MLYSLAARRRRRRGGLAVAAGLVLAMFGSSWGTGLHPAQALEPVTALGGAPGTLATGDPVVRPFTLVAVQAPVPPAPKKPFKLFQSFSFANQPAGLDKCGLTRLPLLTPSYFFNDRKALDRVDRAFADTRLPALKALLAGAPFGIVNIEGPWTIKRWDPQGVVAAKIDSHVDLAAYLRSRLGSKVKFGFYGEAPLKDYFSYQLDYFGNPQSAQYLDFLKAPALAEGVNRQVVRLAAAADVLFPAYYTNWYDDLGKTTAERERLTRQGWTTAAQQSMKLARSWGKPVYPFVWMQYHNAINVPSLQKQFLPRGFFGYQLETLRRLGADGVVIWGTLGLTDRRAVFDKNSDWWREYIAFAKTVGADLRGCGLMPGL